MAEQKFPRKSRDTRQHMTVGKMIHKSKHQRRRDKLQRQRNRSRRVRIYGTKPYCPYCGQVAELVKGYEVGMSSNKQKAWRCSGGCDAHVGCHPNSSTPLGTLANRALRAARVRAHDYFDLLWKSGKMSRKQAYSELEAALGLGEDQAHIGMCDLAQCEEVAAWSRLRLRELYPEVELDDGGRLR